MRKYLKNVLIIFLIVSVQINGGKLTLRGSGCENVSKNLKICDKICETNLLYFFLEGTSFEDAINSMIIEIFLHKKG